MTLANACFPRGATRSGPRCRRVPAALAKSAPSTSTARKAAIFAGITTVNCGRSGGSVIHRVTRASAGESRCRGPRASGLLSGRTGRILSVNPGCTALSHPGRGVTAPPRRLVNTASPRLLPLALRMVVGPLTDPSDRYFRGSREEVQRPSSDRQGLLKVQAAPQRPLPPSD